MVLRRYTQLGLAMTAVAVAAAVSACAQGGTNPQPSQGGTTASAATEATTSAAPAPGGTATAAQAGTTAAAGPGGGPGTGFCKSADLKLSFGGGDAAAGTVYRSLVFTNTSDHPCIIQGFPGISYVGGDDGHQVGLAAERDGTKGAAFTLNKGDSAFATIGFVDVQNYDPQTCQPQPVRGLRVYPPQETASLFIDMPGTGCGNDKLPGNQLTVKTIEKGTGGGS